MLTKPVKQGDIVAVSYSDSARRFSKEARQVIVNKVGRSYIHTNIGRFDFTGRDCTNDPNVYELWDSLQAYEEEKLRGRMITKILSQEWRNLRALPTSSLKAILELMNP